MVGNAISKFLNERKINGSLFTITIDCGIQMQKRHEWKTIEGQSMAIYV